jgi:transporter family-2 protein
MEVLSLLSYALIAGALIPVQSGVNMQLAKILGHPLWGALASFCVGTLSLAIFATITGTKWPSFTQLTQAPYWMWIGGMFGAFFVATAVFVSPRLGATTTVALFIAGQMVMSLLLDHNGAAGFPVHSLNIWRILGAGLVVSGVVLIQRF